MAASEEGEVLLAQAEARANKKAGMFGSMFSRAEAKFEEADDLAGQAANVFKMGKKWDRAAACYLFKAKMQTSLDSKHEAATCYIDASKMLKKADIKASCEPLEKACLLYAQMGRFHLAAKYSMELGEILETDIADLDLAMAKFEEAAGYAEMDGQAGTRLSKCQIRVAKLAATLEKYDEAIKLFEDIAQAYVENDLLKFSCKEYFLKAVLCMLAAKDVEGATVKNERYEGSAAYYRDSRESQLAQQICAALTNEDQEEFTQVVREYDQISKLDPWTTQMLLKIKKQLAGEDELL